MWKRAVLFLLCFLVIFSFILPFVYTPIAGDSTASVEMLNPNDNNDKKKIENFNTILRGEEIKNNPPRSSLSGFAATQVAQVLTGAEFTEMIHDWLVIDFTFDNSKWNSSTNGGHFGYLYSTLNGTFGTTVRTIGIGLLVLYFLLALLERATSDNFTVEVGIKLFVKLIAGYMLIDFLLPSKNSDGLIAGILNLFSFGDVWKKGEPQNIVPSVSVYNEVMEIYNGNSAVALAKLIRMGAPAIVRWIMKIACLGTAIGRILEATLLVVFSPIAVANIFNSSTAGNSSGVRYLKRIAAVALQGAIIGASLTMIEAFIWHNNSWNAFVNLAVMFAGTSFIGKSRSIATEIVD